MASEITGQLKKIKEAISNLGSGVSSDGFLYFPSTTAGLRIRIGSRTGWVYAIDQELLSDGFSGEENTGWENVGGVEVV